MCSISSSVGSSAQWTSSITSSSGNRLEPRAMNELDRVEEVAALLLGREVERLADVGEAAPELGDHARDLGRVLAEVVADDLGRHDRQRLLEHLDERRVGDGALRLVAPPEDRERAALLGLADQLAHQRRLADAGLAADEDEPAVARRAPRRARFRSVAISASRPTNTWWGAWVVSRTQTTSQSRHGSGKPFELVFAGIVEA